MLENIFESRIINWLLTDSDGWIVLFGLIVGPFSLIKAKKFRKKLIESYKEFGLSIVSKQTFLSWADIGYVVIIHKRGAFNFQTDMVKGNVKGFNVGLFTHSVADGSKTGMHQTVVVLELKEHIPDFVLRPTWVRDKVKSSLGIKDINFPTHKKFSEKYFLSCDGDENSVREYFNTSALDYFSDNSKLWVEVNDGKLFVFREYERLLDGRKLGNLLDRSIKISEVLYG